MRLSTLWAPVSLAAMVVIAHEIWPTISVLALVMSLAVGFTLVCLPFRARARSLSVLGEHVFKGLPALSSEVCLFLAAAVLAAGLSSCLIALDLHLAPQYYDAFAACITVLILVSLAIMGLHPITSTVLAGSILMPSVSDPNLLGLTLLLSWSIGVGLSPFSGIQLTLQSRFSLSAVELLKLNRFYAPFMLAVAFIILGSYSALNN